MFHMQERQLSLSLLFKEPVHNAFRHFSCFTLYGPFATTWGYVVFIGVFSFSVCVMVFYRHYKIPVQGEIRKTGSSI